MEDGYKDDTREQRAANVKNTYGILAVDNIKPNDLVKKMMDELYIPGKASATEIKDELIKHYTNISIEKNVDT